MFSLTVQTYMLAVNVALGLTLGFVFDACRALRAVLAGGRPARRPWLDAVMDAVFWLAALPAVLLTWGWGNWGQVRLFTFLGLALGLGLYAALGSPVLFPALAATYRATGQGAVRFVRWNRRVARAAGRAAWRGARGLLRLVRWVLKPVTVPLGWLLAPLLAPVNRYVVDPVRARVQRFVVEPARRRVAAARHRFAAGWDRLRSVLAAWLRPGEDEPPPPAT
ncbi:Spore cortex biosynthesis protein, YabQ [Thermaerobacter marianensis DSM 12885]|uniref:Spore cortex biosynthesis protein, YabQ n=1 Tax=Thermaerobacter marianensis (strain ATCC 700841 / DSM 12885 / JCM 10246 / 7p75a) TaxID=644966 RepID=E6SL28_THEM7|nr:spore cortex biosynthesis protein YabQ [Thermaerobacter marianensis]ADU50230.1 Spore cortex biosynthesis protein, YabQ [Thermaerobacter marianensis DSM 12885]